MGNILYKIISFIIKKIFKGLIIGKKIHGYPKKLYYEVDQHLSFLFQKHINYEEEIQKQIKKYVKKDDIIFDIGANIGQYAVVFSELVGSNGKVFSFEPDFKNFSFLSFNRNINQCSNLYCLNYGVGDEEKILTFFRDTTVGGRTGSFKKEYVGDNYDGFTDIVKIRTLDVLIAEFGEPNFIKIDVEGFELEVIKGLSKDLNSCSFLIELREENKREIYQYFMDRGYKCYRIHFESTLIKNILDVPSFANLIFTKQ